MNFAALLVGLPVAEALANSAPAAPPPAAAAPAPAAPVAPPPRKLPPDVRPPIDGPIATPVPKTRVHWLIDPTTGRALGGFDPIAYFLDGVPRLGDPRWQYDWGGATWLFRNEGDLAAFRAAPEVYAPLFGGRCAFAVSHGSPAEGSPLHHLIWHDRLLLFADATARIAFLTDPDRLFAEATRRWPALAAELQ